MKALISILFGLACLYWVLRDVVWADLAAQLHTIAWLWVVPAVCLEVGSYLFDAIRWRYLFARSSFTMARALQATFIGVLMNQVLPLRMGDLARAAIAGQWVRLPALDVIPALLVARLLDGVCVALAIGAIALLYPLPPSIVSGVRLFGGTVAVLAFLFVLLLRRSPESIAGWADSQGVRKFLGRMATGLSEAGNTSRFWPAALVSAAFLLCQVVSFGLVLRAYGLSLPWLAGTTVFLLVHLSSALPSAPANIGSFQLFVALGLRLFGVDRATAAGFSLVVFVILTLPLFVTGAIALANSDFSLRALSYNPPRR